MVTREKLDAIRDKSSDWVANKRDVAALLDAYSALLAIAEAWQRYQRGEIDWEELHGAVAARCE